MSFDPALIIWRGPIWQANLLPLVRIGLTDQPKTAAPFWHPWIFLGLIYLSPFTKYVCLEGVKNRIPMVHNQCYLWFLISVEVKTTVHNQGYLWFLISVKVKPMVHNQGYLWFLISVKVNTMVHIHGPNKNNGT